jgi:hypothetical protein
MLMLIRENERHCYICAGQTAHRARGTVASVKIETSITDAAITDWR